MKNLIYKRDSSFVGMTAGVQLYTIPFIFCLVWAGSSALSGLPPLQAVKTYTHEKN
ncbi:hypothetical protein [Chryseobacterium sp. SIMBA_029]|uniref:hypothetical protein n=1 Tax=Chryseobacterium sp. SIMBA_029 TaxID=3085772 RepID=UPI00397D71EC